jgi:hypothetical protein
MMEAKQEAKSHCDPSNQNSNNDRYQRDNDRSRKITSQVYGWDAYQEKQSRNERMVKFV